VALRELGIEPDSLPTAFNFFMNVDVLPDGRLKFAPPKCRAGDSMVLRAEMDLAIALSAVSCLDLQRRCTAEATLV
jgi:uncharacterized protein YcgI (DUF1989 family)